MRNYVLLALCCIVSGSFAAQSTNEVFEQGAASHYFSHKSRSEDMKNVMVRAESTCYFIQTDRRTLCPDFVVGHAIMNKSIPRNVLCTAAKKAATAPFGCEKERCKPCIFSEL